MKLELTKIKKIKAMLNEKDLDNESFEYGVFLSLQIRSILE